MALLWLEGFDQYGTTNGNTPAPAGVLARRYTMTSESVSTIAAGRFDGRSLAQVYCEHRKPLLTTNTTLIAGFAHKFSDNVIPNAGTYACLLTFIENTTASLTLWYTGTSLMLVRGATVNNATILAITNPRIKLQPSSWQYIECKAFCNDSTGNYVVRVNGVPVMTGNGGQDTKGGTQGYYDSVKFGESAYAPSNQYDDIYIADASGSNNNDFLGPIHIVPSVPTSDVNNDWDSGGYADVDENPADDNTSTANTANTGFLEFGIGATNNFAAIKGVAATAMYKTSANTTIQVTMNTANTTVNSANISYNSSNYTSKVFVRDLDPSGNAWTPNTVNSTAFGLEVK